MPASTKNRFCRVVSSFGAVEFGWGGVGGVETMCERGAEGTQPDDKKDSLA